MKKKPEATTIIIHPEELLIRLVILPEWIRKVYDQAMEQGKHVRYSYLATPFGTFPVAVEVE